MNRRGFLKFLGFGAGGAALKATLPSAIAWTSTDQLIAGPWSDVAAPELRLGWMTTEIMRLMGERCTSKFQTFPAYRLGEGPLRSQFGVDFLGDFESASPREMSERYLEPMAAALAHAVQREGWGSFGRLEVPRGVLEGAVVTSAGLGISIRGVKDFRPMFRRGQMIDVPFYRFDIVGG